MDTKLKVLMLGPGRKVKGGITTVVNSYFAYGLADKVNIKYLPTMKDGNKVYKLLVFLCTYLIFFFILAKYDLVHIHMAADSSFKRKSYFIKHAKKKNKKIIIHEHSCDFDKYYNLADTRLKNKIVEVLNCCDKLIVLSDEWKQFFQKLVAEEKIAIIYNGVPQSNYLKTDYSDHNILFLGRLGQRKGTYDLLKACQNLKSVGYEFKLYLCGDGNLKEIKQLIDKSELESFVFLEGWIDALKRNRLFNDCSIFVLPSYDEGMPMALLEAMSYGLACISTNVGGIPQVLNAENGLCIEAGDVLGLTAALEKLLNSVELKQNLGKSAKLTIDEKFNVETACNKVLALYNAIEEGMK